MVNKSTVAFALMIIVLSTALVFTVEYIQDIELNLNLTKEFLDETQQELADLEESLKIIAVCDASYIIYKVNSTYYARNGTTGEIDCVGLNASYIINFAIQSLDSGTIRLKAGFYILLNTIFMKSNIYLIGEGRYSTVLNSNITDGSPVISTFGESKKTPMFNMLISDLGIKGSGLDGDGIYFEYCVRNCIVEQIEITKVGGHGIHFYHCFSSNIVGVQTTRCKQNGIHLEYRSHNVGVYRSVSRQNSRFGLYAEGNFAQLTVVGGNYENNYCGDMIIRKGNGATVTGVYFENANPNVWQLQINGSGIAHTIGINECYFNGGREAGGILVNNAINVKIDTPHLEGCNPGIEITSTARRTMLINVYQSASPIIDNGVDTIR